MNTVKLIEFVKQKHETQKRKYTGEPYFSHLFAVAQMADEAAPFGFEIGLCHDILEDAEFTHCDYPTLFRGLLACGYSLEDTFTICHHVVELTDVFTSEAFPDLNRKTRKELEAWRLWKTSPLTQTIKYCDLLHNTDSIAKHDPSFAVKYIEEKRFILKGMYKGNPELYQRCVDNLKILDIIKP